MSSREANIERLNHAITSLNEDAEGMHELIARATEDLENATAASDKVAENAAKMVEALGPMTKAMEKRYEDSAKILVDAKKFTEEQCALLAGQAEGLKDSVNSCLERVDADTVATRISVMETVDDSMAELVKVQKEAFDDMGAKNLKEHERTRDELQTDMLGFKNATSARLDALEAEVAKARAEIKELEDKVSESVGAVSKKLTIPIYAAIGIGVVNLICLVVLLTR